jgi:hypothetical protein
MSRSVIKRPRSISAYRFIGLKATGRVYQIDDSIALKYARDKSEALAREIQMYEIFEGHYPSPYIVQSFLQFPNTNFIAFLGNGSLKKCI